MESLKGEQAADTAAAYNTVLYPGHPRVEAHPAVVGAVARRYGFDPVPAGKSRVLEIGCGDGAHLLPLALAFPESVFVGIDLSSAAIDIARETAATLRLANIDFQVLNLMDLGDDFGQFDYIIAHGFYSWVPADVREKLLSVCRRNLSPRGLVYISYNVFPGWHMRMMLREMLLFHTQSIPDPRKKLDQGRAFLRFLAAGNREGTPYRKLIDEVLTATDAALFHDDMSPSNDPIYFYEFHQHCSAHELQYIGDADWLESRDRSFPDDVRKQLIALENSDFLMKSQYLDFLKNRRFRRSILCHAGIELDRRLKAETLNRFYVSGTLKRTEGDGSQFQSREGEVITITHPIVSTALEILLDRDDRPVLFRDVIDEASRRAGAWNDDPELLAEMFLYLCSVHFLNFYTECPAIAGEPGEKPVASPLARLQACNGTRVTNLLHCTVELKRTLPWSILPLADGTRDRAALKRDVAARFREYGATLAREGESVGSSDDLIARLDTDLEGALNSLAHHALLLPAPR